MRREERRRLGVRRVGRQACSTFALTNENLGGAVRGLRFARVMGFGEPVVARAWGMKDDVGGPKGVFLDVIF